MPNEAALAESQQEDSLIQKRRNWRGLQCCAVAFLALNAGCWNKASDKDTLAKVNNYKILRSEVDKAFKNQTAGAPQPLTPAEDQALRLNILRQIIDVQLHVQRAEKLGIVATDDEVESKLNQVKAPYTKEEFARRLKDFGFTEEEYRQEIRRNLTIEKLLNKEIASKVTISDADIQSYYNERKTEFNLVEPQYYLAHIQVASQPVQGSDKSQSDAQALNRIKVVYNRLESGDDFASAAARFSEDPNTARSGGEISPIPESQLKNMDAATRDAIQKLKPGQYSGIIKVRDPEGYRIVKLIRKEAAGQRDLGDPAVQQWIRNQLRSQREQVLRGAYDEVLRNSAEVHNYYAEQILKENAGQK
ncbi:MAG TPA: SurA N-terminal domain-containing protein [Alphaproteobacteria bacterium]|nr:SurA N-terminal domain-containing protein [Alphaproteobacteria bacterium]